MRKRGKGRSEARLRAPSLAMHAQALPKKLARAQKAHLRFGKENVCKTSGAGVG